jgi:hypothetical protein
MESFDRGTMVGAAATIIPPLSIVTTADGVGAANKKAHALQCVGFRGVLF